MPLLYITLLLTINQCLLVSVILEYKYFSNFHRKLNYWGHRCSTVWLDQGVWSTHQSSSPKSFFSCSQNFLYVFYVHGARAHVCSNYRAKSRNAICVNLQIFYIFLHKSERQFQFNTFELLNDFKPWLFLRNRRKLNSAEYSSTAAWRVCEDLYSSKQTRLFYRFL